MGQLVQAQIFCDILYYIILYYIILYYIILYLLQLGFQPVAVVGTAMYKRRKKRQNNTKTQNA